MLKLLSKIKPQSPKYREPLFAPDYSATILATKKCNNSNEHSMHIRYLWIIIRSFGITIKVSNFHRWKKIRRIWPQQTWKILGINETIAFIWDKLITLSIFRTILIFGTFEFRLICNSGGHPKTYKKYRLLKFCYVPATSAGLNSS